jgi:orotidine-5'-phosphate decarboxylase
MTSPAHAADRLMDAVDRCRAPVCVGLDPVVERLPAPLRAQAVRDPVAALRRFSEELIDAVAGSVPAIKLQSACFERYRGAGVAALFDVMDRAQARGLEVILDAKRGDIPLTAEHYAAAAFGAGGGPPDWVTVSAYMGSDSVAPFLRAGRGAFALVRTSNAGAAALQARRLEGGGTVAQAVAGMVAELGAGHLGGRGYSALGAVVAATEPAEAATLRAIMPRQILLLPGFGAQGGTLEDIRPAFAARGQGALVTASRSVIYAFGPGPDWQRQVAGAAAALAAEVGEGLGMR